MKISETVTTIVSLLGGPDINPEEIDWALDLPAGQKLLEWLVSQVQLELSADDASGIGTSDSLRAALQAIALEDHELQMYVSLISVTLALIFVGCGMPPEGRPPRCLAPPPNSRSLPGISHLGDSGIRFNS